MTQYAVKDNKSLESIDLSSIENNISNLNSSKQDKLLSGGVTEFIDIDGKNYDLNECTDINKAYSWSYNQTPKNFVNYVGNGGGYTLYNYRTAWGILQVAYPVIISNDIPRGYIYVRSKFQNWYDWYQIDMNKVSPLPSEFIQVEYLQSNNAGEYIQLPQTITASLLMSGKMAWHTTIGDWDMACGLWSNLIIGGNSTSNIQLCGGQKSVTISVSLNTPYTFTIGAYHGVTWNGSRKVTSTLPNETNGRRFCIFAVPDAHAGSDSPYSWGHTYGYMRWYSLKLYDTTDGNPSNSTLLYDLYPCYSNTIVTGYKASTTVTVPTGTPGMYDLVNKKFYVNSGSGTFTYGNRTYDKL